MKKKYIEPLAEEIKIGVASVICTSGLSMGGDTDSEGITDADSRDFSMDDIFEVKDYDNF